MPVPNLNVETIQNLLPQTQCGLCGYKGCKPYAEALVHHHARIDLCLPGGVYTLKALADAFQQDATPYMEGMKKKATPNQRVDIKEDACIGCTKCIQACPVDAIVGAAKQLHTVISDICTGCGLCLPPCPVDCIDIVVLPELNPLEKQQQANKARAHFEAREARLNKPSSLMINQSLTPDRTNAKEKISIESVKAAVERAKAKRELNPAFKNSFEENL